VRPPVPAAEALRPTPAALPTAAPVVAAAAVPVTAAPVIAPAAAPAPVSHKKMWKSTSNYLTCLQKEDKTGCENIIAANIVSINL
jgi:hypothetical protein